MQYSRTRGARVIGVDTGKAKQELVASFGVQFVDVSSAATFLLNHN